MLNVVVDVNVGIHQSALATPTKPKLEVDWAELGRWEAIKFKIMGHSKVIQRSFKDQSDNELIEWFNCRSLELYWTSTLKNNQTLKSNLEIHFGHKTNKTTNSINHFTANILTLIFSYFNNS